MVPDPTTRREIRLGPPRDLQRDLGHDIDRVGRHQQDRLRRRLQYARDHVAEHGGIALQQFQPRLTRPLVGACRQHDDARLGKRPIVARVHRHGISEGSRVKNVFRLSNRQIKVAVDQHDFRADSAHHHGIGGGAADEAGSDDSDFHGLILMT